MLFVYGRILSQRLVNTVTSDKVLFRLVRNLIKYHMVVCYSLYIAGNMCISILSFKCSWASSCAKSPPDAWQILFFFFFTIAIYWLFFTIVWTLNTLIIFHCIDWAQDLYGSLSHWRRRCTSTSLASMLGHTWFWLLYLGSPLSLCQAFLRGFSGKITIKENDDYLIIMPKQKKTWVFFEDYLLHDTILQVGFEYLLITFAVPNPCGQRFRLDFLVVFGRSLIHNAHLKGWLNEMHI